jgi:hypothetical protein
MLRDDLRGGCSHGTVQRPGRDRLRDDTFVLLQRAYQHHHLFKLHGVFTGNVGCRGRARARAGAMALARWGSFNGWHQTGVSFQKRMGGRGG